jgi:hypothetical protein
MWTKEAPKKPGYYWATMRGELTGKEYTKPVHVYSTHRDGIVDIAFSDGDGFSIDSDMFIEWFSEEIAMPAKEYKTKG